MSELRYIVQYINQSEAGFYLQGMRLHVFQVTKRAPQLGVGGMWER